MIIGGFTTLKDGLIINNYQNLESIVVKKESLQNLNSLKICNCEKLKTIEIEDSCLHNVKNVIIESTWYNLIIQSINLPSLQSFQTGYNSFKETTSLSLSSNSIKFYFSLHLPNLQSFKTGNFSFICTTSLSLSSNSIQFYFSLYLPNLQSFITGNGSFHETTSLSLSSNSI